MLVCWCPWIYLEIESSTLGVVLVVQGWCCLGTRGAGPGRRTSASCELWLCGCVVCRPIGRGNIFEVTPVRKEDELPINELHSATRLGQPRTLSLFLVYMPGGKVA